MQLVAETDLPGPRRSWTRRALLAGVAALTFVSVALAIHGRLPGPSDSHLTIKLDAFAERADDCDVLFLGSSTTFRHIDPALFDRRLAAEGHPLRSFNLGVPGMGGAETLYALRRVLALDPARLRWVVTDARDEGLVLRDANLFTGRVTRFHDLTTAALITRVLVADGLEQPDLLRRHWAATAYGLANVGRGRELWLPALGWNAAWRAEQSADQARLERLTLGDAGNGFVSLDEEFRRCDEERRQDLLKRRAAWLRSADRVYEWLRHEVVSGRAGGGPESAGQKPPPGERVLLQAFLDEAARHDVQLVFVTMPEFDEAAHPMELAAGEGLLPHLIDLDDPARYPRLYAPDTRFDRMHLNGKGARVYTDLLARRFAELLDGEPGS